MVRVSSVHCAPNESFPLQCQVSRCTLCDAGLDHPRGYFGGAVRDASCPILDARTIQSVLNFPHSFSSWFYSLRTGGE